MTFVHQQQEYQWRSSFPNREKLWQRGSVLITLTRREKRAETLHHIIKATYGVI